MLAFAIFVGGKMRLNYFIVALTATDTKIFYLRCSDIYLYLKAGDVMKYNFHI